MVNKNWKLINILPILALCIFIGGFVILCKDGCIAMLGYYKDFVANMAVAILAIYLLVVEKKEKQLQKDLHAIESQTKQIASLFGRQISGIEVQYKDVKQKELEIARMYRCIKGEKEIIIYLLTGFTVLSAMLAMVSYILH